jgi:hypothetical protein
MSDDNKMLQPVALGDVMTNLAELAGVDMSQVQEVRGFLTPAGILQLRGVKGSLDIMGTEEGKPAVIFEFEIKDVKTLSDKTLDPNEVIGKKHREVFFLSEKEDLGRVKAFCIDCGASNGMGSLGQIVEAVGNGHEFYAQINHRKNKNDPNQVYANIDRNVLAKTKGKLAGT